jgi:hypothetical protein
MDVFLCEPLEIDPLVFSLWLRGCNIDEAFRQRIDSEPEVTRQFQDFQSLLRSETRDQFRIFLILEPYLQSPPTFLTQELVQVPTATKKTLIEQYYAFDEAVVRELFGKKLSTRNRKDLDDVSEKTGVSLKSCRRQFDNIKQILRVVDDYEGSLVENIKTQFILLESLARSYASVVFVSHNRFDTNKRKLTHLSFSDFTYCANQMIDRWTAGAEGSHAVDDDLELDRDFLQELHDLKLSLIDRVWIDRQQKLVMKELRRKKLPPATLKAMEANFKSISKSITQLGTSLIHSKDVRDFFIDVIEKIVEPCKQLGLSKEDTEHLLGSIASTFPECEGTHAKHTSRSREKPWRGVYLRYLDTLTNCVLVLYHD